MRMSLLRILLYNGPEDLLEMICIISLAMKEIYNFDNVDHPLNTKLGGVCLYYKFPLPLKVMDILNLQKLVTKHD